MFLPIVFILGAALAPAPPAADAVAVRYLSEACRDGSERYAAVTDDGVLHPLTVISDADEVLPEDAGFRALCHRGSFTAYHCHPRGDVLSQFPSPEDLAFVAFAEYLCAAEDVGTPIIRHRMVADAGNGRIVAFGLRGAFTDHARSLGSQLARALAPASSRLDRHGIPDVRPTLDAFPRVFAVNAELKALYKSVEESYLDRVLTFMREACPGAATKEAFASCSGLTPDAFARTIDACEDVFVETVEASAGACRVARGERLMLDGPRFPGWTELTPENYDRFTNDGSVVLGFCDDAQSGIGRSCSVVLGELERKLPRCGTLKRAYVDVGRYATLSERHEAGFREVVLLDGGRRYDINARSPSEQVFRLILCGPAELFGSIAH